MGTHGRPSTRMIVMAPTVGELASRSVRRCWSGGQGGQLKREDIEVYTEPWASILAAGRRGSA